MGRKKIASTISRPSLANVAARADVSVAAVSIALRFPNTKRVSQVTRQRILEAAAACGYHPHAAARELSTGRTFLLGAITPLTPHHVEAVQSAHDHAAAHGFEILHFGANVAARQAEALDICLERRVEGLLIASVEKKPSPEMLNLYQQRDVPMVALFSPTEGIAFSVLCDTGLAALLAVETLRKAGHRRIAVLACPAHHTGVECVAGYRRAMEAAGLGPENRRVVATDYAGTPSTRAAIRALLQERLRPTAVLAAPDYVAVAAWQEAAKLGLRVPADLSIVGIGDYHLGQTRDGQPDQIQVYVGDCCMPPLTMVREDRSEAGRQACALLLQRLNGPDRTAATDMAR